MVWPQIEDITGPLFNILTISVVQRDGHLGRSSLSVRSLPQLTEVVIMKADVVLVTLEMVVVIRVDLVAVMMVEMVEVMNLEGVMVMKVER